jgi:hypothetical protein
MDHDSSHTAVHRSTVGHIHSAVPACQWTMLPRRNWAQVSWVPSAPHERHASYIHMSRCLSAMLSDRLQPSVRYYCPRNLGPSGPRWSTASRSRRHPGVWDCACLGLRLSRTAISDAETSVACSCGIEGRRGSSLVFVRIVSCPL